MSGSTGGATEAPITPPHWTDLDHPGVPDFDTVDVVGADAATYLQSQLSQDLDRIPVGGSGWSFVLEPTGKVVALVRVRRLGDEHIALDTDGGHGRELLERINRFRIRVAVDVALEEGTGSIDPVAEARRIALGWPRHGREIESGVTIPAETGLIGAAVSFTKGCYPGQELVERMDSRAAAAPVSLRRVVVAEGTAPGSVLLGADGSEIGRITSVAGTEALAYVRRGVDSGVPVVFVAPSATT